MYHVHEYFFWDGILVHGIRDKGCSYGVGARETTGILVQSGYDSCTGYHVPENADADG